MQNVLKNSLISVTAALMGAGGFYLYTEAATTDTINVSVTVPATLSISDDGVNFSIASLTPGAIDTTQTSTLTVAANGRDGFDVTIDLEDLGATAGQLCADSNPNDGSCDASGNVFDGDGTASYISVTTDAGAGTLAGLTGATFTVAETKLGPTSVQLFTAADPTNSTTFEVDYDAFADFSVVPDSYEGVITFTIVAGT